MNAPFRIFYYGCLAGLVGQIDAGHFLYAPEPDLDRQPWGRSPFPFKAQDLDGAFAPCGAATGATYQPQSLATVHVFHGWTVLSMWDRSGDARGNSSSTFFAEGIHDGPKMLKLAAAWFPSIWARINATAPVRLVGGAS